MIPSRVRVEECSGDFYTACPVCVAGTGKHCEMYSGLGRRNEPHPERKYFAVQTIEHGYGPVILACPVSAIRVAPDNHRNHWAPGFFQPCGCCDYPFRMFP
ncbi:MAG: hypothetical protein M3O09_08050, partial [Acidobacteriota bacterium]|nr:hypothetical protein [Acidobacteriota bacterium]